MALYVYEETPEPMHYNTTVSTSLHNLERLLLAAAPRSLGVGSLSAVSALRLTGSPSCVGFSFANSLSDFLPLERCLLREGIVRKNTVL